MLLVTVLIFEEGEGRAVSLSSIWGSTSMVRKVVNGAGSVDEHEAGSTSKKASCSPTSWETKAVNGDGPRMETGAAVVSAPSRGEGTEEASKTTAAAAASWRPAAGCRTTSGEYA